MVKPKQFSGKDAIKIFTAQGFVVKRTSGSHVRMTLVQNHSSYHVTIPLHDVLKKGTLSGIMKDFALCFGQEEMEKHFF